LHLVFAQLDSNLTNQAAINGDSDGTTCLMALVQWGKLTIASLGDSVGTLIKKDGSFYRVSEEHTPATR
jgi:serine/threonine protein phosphatase PrpC